MICGFAIIWGFPIVAASFSLDFAFLDWVLGPLMFASILYFGASYLLLVCPRCSRSIFKRKFGVRVFWPAKICGKCGTDLTEAP